MRKLRQEVHEPSQQRRKPKREEESRVTKCWHQVGDVFTLYAGGKYITFVLDKDYHKRFYADEHGDINLFGMLYSRTWRGVAPPSSVLYVHQH